MAVLVISMPVNSTVSSRNWATLAALCADPQRRISISQLPETLLFGPAAPPNATCWPESGELVAAVHTAIPSARKATWFTSPECIMGGPSAWPVAVSHRRAVLSRLPVSTNLPSWRTRRLRTCP